MKKLYIIIILVYFLQIISCSGSHVNKDMYFVSNINSKLFEGYHWVTLKNKNKKQLFLISQKNENINAIDTIEKIKIGSNYTLTIHHLDSSITLNPSSIRTANGQIFIGNVLIWENDTVKTDLYMSNDLIDLYIIKNK